MKKNTKNFILAATLFGIAAATGTTLAIHDSYERAKQRKDKAVKNLQLQNSELKDLQYKFGKQIVFYSDSAANYAEKNPQYDDMNTLYDMCVKASEQANKNYENLERKFLKKISNIGKKFCYPDGGYHFVTWSHESYYRPKTISDWMFILEENANQIPNFKSLQTEEENLEHLKVLTSDFVNFVYFDMYGYVINDKMTRQEDQKVILNNDVNNNVDNKYLEDHSYHIVDSIHAFNNLDNIKQNELINKLVNDCLYKFAVFGKHGMNLIDNDYMKKIRVFAMNIQKHNELESGKISYQKAFSDIYNQLQINKEGIVALQSQNSK